MGYSLRKQGLTFRTKANGQIEVKKDEKEKKKMEVAKKVLLFLSVLPLEEVDFAREENGELDVTQK